VETVNLLAAFDGGADSDRGNLAKTLAQPTADHGVGGDLGREESASGQDDVAGGAEHGSDKRLGDLLGKDLWVLGRVMPVLKVYVHAKLGGCDSVFLQRERERERDIIFYQSFLWGAQKRNILPWRRQRRQAPREQDDKDSSA